MSERTGYIICWDMVDSTSAIRNDFVTASRYLDTIARQVNILSSSYDAELLQSIGDGQTWLISDEVREETAEQFAVAIIQQARMLKRDFPDYLIKVALGHGTIISSELGPTGPILWQLNHIMKHTPRQTLRIIKQRGNTK